MASVIFISIKAYSGNLFEEISLEKCSYKSFNIYFYFYSNIYAIYLETDL